MPSCALIIVNWNSWGLLAKCLEKVQRQTIRQDVEVFVVDNASDEFAPDDFLATYSDVNFILNQTNRGFASANNQIIELISNYKWVALLNPDAYPNPDWLQKLISAAERNLEYSMFASRQLIDADRNLLDGDGDAYHFSGLAWRRGHGSSWRNINTGEREVFSPCGAAALYSIEAFISAGGFDEDFFCYIEDVDLGFRLRLLGNRCLLVPDAVVRHVGSATTGGGQSDFALYHGHRNLVWAYVKNMPSWLFWCCLPAHVLMNLVVTLVYAGKGKAKVVLKAKYDALMGLPKMWRKRKEIQKRRVVTNREIWRQLDKGILLTGKRKLRKLG